MKINSKTAMHKLSFILNKTDIFGTFDHLLFFVFQDVLNMVFHELFFCSRSFCKVCSYDDQEAKGRKGPKCSNGIHQSGDIV